MIKVKHRKLGSVISYLKLLYTHIIHLTLVVLFHNIIIVLMKALGYFFLTIKIIYIHNSRC